MKGQVIVIINSNVIDLPLLMTCLHFNKFIGKFKKVTIILSIWVKMKAKKVLLRQGVSLNQNMSAIPVTFTGAQVRLFLDALVTGIPPPAKFMLHFEKRSFVQKET